MTRRQLAKSLGSDAGSVLVLTAIALPVLVAFAALALDVGYVYDYRQRMSAASDAAAISGAMEIKRNSSLSQPQLEAWARDSAGRNGIVHGTDDVTVTVTRGDFSGDVFTAGSSSSDKYVEVVITRPIPTFLLGIIGWSTMTADASAIAGPDGGGAGCVYALNTNDPRFPIELDVEGGGTVINTPNCGVISNGDFAVGSGSSITSNGVSIVASTGSVSGTVTPAPVYNSSVFSDPFADMDQVGMFETATADCPHCAKPYSCYWEADKIKSGVTTRLTGTSYFKNGLPGSEDTAASYVLEPGVYCGNASVRGLETSLTNDPAYTTTYKPGVYIINGGGTKMQHQWVFGTAVTFYYTASPGYPYMDCGDKVFQSDPPDKFYLSAPTSGLYEGLLLIQDRKQGTVLGTPAIDCSSNPILANLEPDIMSVNGVIYFPNHHVKYRATTPGGGAYTVLVGGTISFTDVSTLNSDFSSLASGSPVKRTGIARLP